MFCFREKFAKEVLQVRRYCRNHSFVSKKNAFFSSGIGQATRFRPSDSRNKLIAYSIFAWITPAVIVIISVTLDKTNTIIVRYGKSNTLFVSSLPKIFHLIYVLVYAYLEVIGASHPTLIALC